MSPEYETTLLVVPISQGLHRLARVLHMTRERMSQARMQGGARSRRERPLLRPREEAAIAFWETDRRLNRVNLRQEEARWPPIYECEAA